MARNVERAARNVSGNRNSGSNVRIVSAANTDSPIPWEQPPGPFEKTGRAAAGRPVATCLFQN
jgi:hypothetical protein